MGEVSNRTKNETAEAIHMKILGNKGLEQLDICLENPTYMEDKGIELEPTVSISATKEKEGPQILIVEDLEGVEVWDRNYNPSL